jgi:hypothetical protein
MCILLVHYFEKWTETNEVKYYGPFEDFNGATNHFNQHRAEIAHKLGLQEHEIEYDYKMIENPNVF